MKNIFTPEIPPVSAHAHAQREEGKRTGDDPTLKTRTNVKIERVRVTAATTLKAALIKNGGYAIRLVPATDADKFPAYR